MSLPAHILLRRIHVKEFIRVIFYFVILLLFKEGGAHNVKIIYELFHYIVFAKYVV